VERQNPVADLQLWGETHKQVLRRPATLNGGLTPGARPQITFPFSGSAASRHMSPRSRAGHNGSNEQMFGAK
jgi:hypothetical protein